MKKLIQNLLVILFIFHLLLCLAVNVDGLGFVKKESNNNLSSFGQIFRKNFIGINLNYTWMYSNFTSTDRGYGYYSPNMSSVKNQFQIFINGKRITNTTLPGEASLKFGVLMTNLTLAVKDKRLREKIVLSTYYNIQRKHNAGEIKDMRIAIQTQNFKPLNLYNWGERRDSLKIFNAFYINRK